MARIRSTGGIATLQRIPGAASDPATLQVNVRLFAKTETGLLAIDPSPQSYAAGIPRDALARGEEYALTGLVSAPEFLAPEAGEGRVQGPWHRVIEELTRTFKIETDPETLQALPFELMLDRELADELPK